MNHTEASLLSLKAFRVDSKSDATLFSSQVGLIYTARFHKVMSTDLCLQF